MVDTSHKFVEHLRESGLLEADRLDAYLKYLGDLSSLDPKVIADRMVADRLLTEFQSSQLLKGRSKGFILRQVQDSPFTGRWRHGKGLSRRAHDT